MSFGAENIGLYVEMVLGLLFFCVSIYSILNSTIKFKGRFKENWEQLLTVLFGFAFAIGGVYIFLLGYNLRYESIYVEGVTIDYCKDGDGGENIEFEYFIKDVRFTNCNSFPKDRGIRVPGDKFKVRVSSFAPSIGRIDFDKPI